LQLIDILNRDPHPAPWSEVSKIPWDDPEFSARMLREHLTQEHNAASRRSSIIADQVEWIHSALLDGQPSNILDLGCGPGLYCTGLARFGQHCTGIDFGPASVAHARQLAAQDGLSCEFIQGDIRATPYGSDRDAVMLIFGEFNTFQRPDALDIVRRSHDALAPGGQLLLEVHTAASIKAIGESSPSWSARQQGLYSSDPYIVLNDACWHEDSRTAVSRHFVIDIATGDVSLYGTTTQAYDRGEMESLLRDGGFTEIRWHDGWPNAAHRDELELVVASL
jgi:SAM-dependent methyltransferase